MSINPFAPPLIRRTAILTLDNGFKFRADITMPQSDKPVFHKELEEQLVRDFNQSQPRAVHKVVKIHLLRN